MGTGVNIDKEHEPEAKELFKQNQVYILLQVRKGKRKRRRGREKGGGREGKKRDEMGELAQIAPKALFEPVRAPEVRWSRNNGSNHPRNFILYIFSLI